MKIVKILIGVALLTLFCSLPAHAQLAAPAFPVAHFCPPTHFRVVAVSGSPTTYQPSSFVAYDQAVAIGSADAHASFLNYDQAVQKGLASPDTNAKASVDPNTNPSSLADVARAYRIAKQQQAASDNHR